MAKWTFSDGTMMQSGGSVTGTSRLADDLRRYLATSWTVTVAQLPDGLWPLNPSSDFTLNALAVEEAARPHRGGLDVTTDYVEGGDVPAEVRSMRKRQSAEGRVY